MLEPALTIGGTLMVLLVAARVIKPKGFEMPRCPKCGSEVKSKPGTPIVEHTPHTISSTGRVFPPVDVPDPWDGGCPADTEMEWTGRELSE